MTSKILTQRKILADLDKNLKTMEEVRKQTNNKYIGH
jgi:hypothetical protein